MWLIIYVLSHTAAYCVYEIRQVDYAAYMEYYSQYRSFRSTTQLTGASNTSTGRQALRILLLQEPDNFDVWTQIIHV